MKELMQSAAGSAALALVFAVLNCLWGYRLQKIWIACAGFAAGAWLGYVVSSSLTHTTWVLWLVTLCLGAALAALAFRAYLLGIFLLACAGTAYAGWLWLPGVWKNAPHWGLLAVCLAAGVVAGVLAVKFTRPALIVITGLSGGVTAIESAVRLLESFKLLPVGTSAAWAVGVIGLVAAAGGIAFQFKTAPKR